MMRLNLMRDFFAGVDERWASPLLDAIAAPWVGLAAKPRMLRASANFVAVLLEPRERYILRCNHESERTAAGIAAELEFIRHLAQCGLAVAGPVAVPGGGEVASVSTPLGLFHAVLFARLPGDHPELDELDSGGFQQWGAALAQLHLASASCPPLNRPSWREHGACAREWLAPEDGALRAELDEIESQLTALPRDRESYGLIHFDFELDNLMAADGSWRMLDFDDCAYYWYEADIAFALRDLWGDRPAALDLADRRLRDFLGGYRALRALSAEALARLPLFARWHNLYMYARLRRALADPPAAEEPQWLAGLRAKLGGMIEGYRRA